MTLEKRITQYYLFREGILFLSFESGLRGHITELLIRMYFVIQFLPVEVQNTFLITLLKTEHQK